MKAVIHRVKELQKEFKGERKLKIALVGSSGYIAGYIEKKLCKDINVEKIIKIDQTSDADLYLDLAEPEFFKFDILNDIDLVIFTAAISAPDKCAKEFDFCWKINVTGTEYFISNALKKGCRVLFFSSDAVFGDIPGAVYDESSETRAKTPYGRMKKNVEDAFRENENFKAIRLSYVVSANDRFVSYCLTCIRKREVAEVFHPFYRNCIVVSDVVDVVVWLAYHWNELYSSVLNIAGIELISRVRIVDELNRLCGNVLRYAVLEPEKEFFTNRPKITQMKSLYLYKHSILKEETFIEKLKRELAGVCFE